MNRDSVVHALRGLAAAIHDRCVYPYGGARYQGEVEREIQLVADALLGNYVPEQVDYTIRHSCYSHKYAGPVYCPECAEVDKAMAQHHN